MSQFWPPIRRPEAGAVVAPVVAAGAVSAAIAVTFSQSFPVPPQVVAVSTNARLTVEVTSVTVAGASIKVANWTSAPTSATAEVRWIASL